ncbi:MAG: NCS2 family permease [Planctomycetota bacterium]|nr:NCS2 family permease [Planctomycetota bacterium]
MRWFVRGDVDGFFGLALDNLVQLLLIDALCRFVLGFSNELIYGAVLPGAAVSLVVGNVFYAWQAKKLAEKTGRTDICALPYGINTVSLFAYVFLVMLPAKLAALEAGLNDAEAARAAWQAGLVACLGSGLIEFAGAFVADWVRKHTPRAALLSTLAGIALSFIALGFLFRTFARPTVGFTTLGIILLTYFGRVRFIGGIPGGLVAVVVGTAIFWIQVHTGGMPSPGPMPSGGLTFHPPMPVFGDLAAALKSGFAVQYLSVILPMGIFNVVGSLQNIESAEAAGDSYPMRPSMAVNGVGTLAAALFGSCFPTTIYIGHPGWKAMGARAGYSILNAVFVTAVCLTGTLALIGWAVPIDAGMAIVLWIGIVITAQSFQATPPHHAPASVIGILPGVGAWGALMMKQGLRAAGLGTPQAPFTADLIGRFLQTDTWAHGAFALEQGFIFTAMIWAAATVEVIERRFYRAAAWCLVAAVFSGLGLMHSYQWTVGDTAILLAPARDWAIGYGVMALTFALANFITVPGEGH